MAGTDRTKRHAVINRYGEVESAIIWDGTSPYVAPGKYIIFSPMADAGDTYDFETDTLYKANRRARDAESNS